MGSIGRRIRLSQPYLKKTQAKRAQGHGSSDRDLPNKHKALSSNLRTAKT
jgi:hypothetical protein